MCTVNKNIYIEIIVYNYDATSLKTLVHWEELSVVMHLRLGNDISPRLFLCFFKLEVECDRPLYILYLEVHKRL